MTRSAYRSACKVSIFLSDSNGSRLFWTVCRKNAQTSYLTQIRPVGAVLFHADGQTHVAKLLVAFRSFPNAPQNSKQLHAALP